MATFLYTAEIRKYIYVILVTYRFKKIEKAAFIFAIGRMCVISCIAIFIQSSFRLNTQSC